MNQKYEKSQISDWVAAYRESGDSIYEFCKDKPFHASDLFHWLEVNGSKVDVLQRAIVDEPGNFIEVDGPWPTAVYSGDTDPPSGGY